MMKKKVNEMSIPVPNAPCWSFLSEITVEPVLFLYMVSTFSQYALFQDLVYSKVCNSQYNVTVCSSLHSDEFQSELTQVQTESSHWILMSTISMVIPSLLIAMYLGSWSDKFGRKWPVVIPPFGGALSCGVYIAISFWKDSSVAFILLASSLSGLCGGFVSCIMSCMTYVAAVSSEENRTVRISRLEAMTFLGGTIGPFVSGSMLEITGHGYAFFFMMISYLLAFFYAIFFVKNIRGEAATLRRLQARVPASMDPVQPILAPPCDSEDLKEDSRREAGGFSTVGLLTAKDDAKKAKLERSERRTGGASPTLLPGRAEKGKRSYGTAADGSESSSRSSSSCTHTEDSSSSSNSFDEERNIIKVPRVRKAAEDPHVAPASCCSTYFGSDHFVEAMSTAFRKREENRRLFILLVIIASYIAMMVTAGELDVAYLFAKDQPLAWSYQTYSYYFGGKYGIGALVLLLGMPVFQKFGLDDTSICIIGIISRMAGLVVYGLSKTTFMAFTVPIWSIFSFFTIPATRALLSKLVCSTEHGKMFSFVAIMEDLCTLSASILFNSLYPITRTVFGGLIFFVAAGLLFIPLGIIWFVRKNLKLTRLPISSSSTPSRDTIVE